MGFIDTHSHILLTDDCDPTILKRALSLDHVGLICLDDHDLNNAIRLKRRYPSKFTIAYGLFPCDGTKLDKKARESVYQTMDHPLIDIIGEIGLDYHWESDPDMRQLQQKVFIEQIERANAIDRPIAIHTRDAWEDTLKILHDYPCHGIIHCFSGSREVMQECIKMGYYISFAGPLTYKNANKLLQAAKDCPLDRILSETDSPYLSPVPLRGQTNEPYNVHYVVEKIAELKGLDVQVVADAIKQNYSNLMMEWLTCELS